VICPSRESILLKKAAEAEALLVGGAEREGDGVAVAVEAEGERGERGEIPLLMRY